MATKQIQGWFEIPDIAAMDRRAKALGLSRREWLRRAVRWALTQPITEAEDGKV